MGILILNGSLSCPHWLPIVWPVAGIVLTILGGKTAEKLSLLDSDRIRKALHSAVGLLFIWAVVVSTSPAPLAVVCLAFTAINFIILRSGAIRSMTGGATANMGTVYFPLASFVLIVLFWSYRFPVITASMAVLTFGDTAAAAVGTAVRRPHIYNLTGSPKSIEGSTAMFVVSAGVLIAALYLHGITLDAPVLAVAALCAAVTTVAEAAGSKGWDNVLIPVICGLILFFGLSAGGREIGLLLLGTAVAGGIARASTRARFLTPGGAAIAFLMGVCIFGMGGSAWTVPILIFFVVSSIISKVRKKDKAFLDDIVHKGSRRDHSQVLANGLVAWIAVCLHVIHPHPLWYVVYVTALAAATADTWATEIGVLSSARPRSITTFKPVERGLSGGITPLGTAASLAGALLVALSAMPFVYLQTGTTAAWLFAGAVTLAGLSGSLFDSILGATVQARFVCPACGKAVEKRTHCGMSETVFRSGIRWMSNDIVNLSSTAWSTLVALALYRLVPLMASVANR